MAKLKQAQKTWEELEAIRLSLVDDIFPSIKNTRKELEDYRNELLLDNAENPSIKARIAETEGKLVELKSQTEEKVAQILEMHKSVFGNGTQDDSIKSKLETFLNDAQGLFEEAGEKKEEFDSFYIKVFGEEKPDGSIAGGLKSELENYTAKYDDIFQKIESLLPGATSAGLAKVFEDKVTHYAKSEKIWTILFLIVAVMLSVYYGVFAWINDPSTSFGGSFLNLLHKTPFLLFAVWLLVFIGNRRAENKKLEELYKHKEVMARAYVGYKEHVEELEGESTEKTLLKKHMENLLNAIQENSGKFLSNEGDKHPFWDKLIPKNKKGAEVIGENEN